MYENVAPQDALWTFDISTSTWEKRRATGQLPVPHLAHIATGLAVANGKAYALINEPEASKRLEVYELDLATWHWRKVLGAGSQPSCRRAASAVVIQVGGHIIGYCAWMQASDLWGMHRGDRGYGGVCFIATGGQQSM